jgi:anti-sigma B factor antagonist
MPGSRLYVGREGDSFFARVAGRGDFGLGPVLEERAEEAIRGGALNIVVDFQSCSYLDSTFLGALVAVAIAAERVHGRIILNCISDWIRERLRTMGLSHMFQLAEQPFAVALQGRPEPALSEVPVGELSREETARYILRAHERLAQMCPELREHLRRVVEALRKELGSKA